MQLTDFDIDGFLRDYWQKKPLLIRNPWSAWQNPLEPDDLAGLACENDVESRLIIQTGETWALESGPFPEARFSQLGPEPWTLLVQAADHFVEDVAALIAPFRFVPNWRVDDVMVSYAPDGGGVGPHFDQYDVFLIQGLGQRRWQVGALCDAATPLLPHADLRLLANFEPVEEWILEPGDILYVPPGVAHNGVAVGDDCMTYSIGFRAPSRHELIVDWCDHVAEQIPDDDRYRDPDLRRQDNPGEISAAALARLHDMMTEAMLDRDAFARWFGQYNSIPKYPEADWRPDDAVEPQDFAELLAGGGMLCRNPASRFSFIRRRDGVWLFVDGDCFACDEDSAGLAEGLCAQARTRIDPAVAASAAVRNLLAALYNQGSLTIEPRD
ncbi:MAG TPA: cupin domain-containing protein [Sphingobium sp.]|nr:cupin domain-containing protein [Sphingobium sp.]